MLLQGCFRTRARFNSYSTVAFRYSMRRSLGGVAVLLLFDSARCAPVPESIWAAVSGCAALKDTKNSIGEKSLSAALDPHSSGRRGAGCDSQGSATVVVGL